MTGDPAAMTSPPAGADPGSIRPLPAPSFRGTPPFPEAARRALANDQLRTNLRRATTTIRTKRQRAVDERDDWEALRVAGAAIKDDVLARLPELLIELESNVTAAGGVVHWARDAAEANRIVADLVRAAGANEVVKVKSMVTQEIELNDACVAEDLRIDVRVRPTYDQPVRALLRNADARLAGTACASFFFGHDLAPYFFFVSLSTTRSSE